MKKRKQILLLVVLLLSAFTLHAQQQVALPPLVSVTGTGEVRVQPDEVVVNLGVETREKTLEAARKETDKKAAAIINYLKKKGVEAGDIQTSFVTLNPVFNSGDYGSTTPDFYVAQKNMTVVIKKLNRFDELLSGLYDLGANHVNGIHFRVSDVEKYKEEARKKAVASAKQKAAMLTAELGAKLGRVYAISETNGYSGPQPLYKTARVESVAMDVSAGPSIAGGEVVISSDVNVSFIIE